MALWKKATRTIASTSKARPFLLHIYKGCGLVYRDHKLAKNSLLTKILPPENTIQYLLEMTLLQVHNKCMIER